MQCISITYQPWIFKMCSSLGKPISLSNERATVLLLNCVSNGISDSRFILCINLIEVNTCMYVCPHTHIQGRNEIWSTLHGA